MQTIYSQCELVSGQIKPRSNIKNKKTEEFIRNV
jgi:hypothetical protein